MRGSLTPKERARITELQDQLIVRFVNHRLAVAQGEEHQARALEMEIDELPSCCGRRRTSKRGPLWDRPSFSVSQNDACNVTARTN